MANSFITDHLENDNVTVTRAKYEELQLISNRNFILEAKVNELLIKINELQGLLNQKIPLRTKTAVKAISDVHFK